MVELKKVSNLGLKTGVFVFEAFEKLTGPGRSPIILTKGGEVPLVSFREYARMQGIALSSLQDRMKRGTIPEHAIDRSNPKRPKIISEVADQEFAARRSEIGEQVAQMQKPPAASPPAAPEPANVIDEMFGPAADEHKGKSPLNKKLPPLPKSEFKKEVIAGQEVEVEKVPYAGTDNFDRYRGAKANSEELKARKLELDVAEMEGRLVDVKEAREEIQKICTAIRENILNVPAKAAPELFACTDMVELETKLYKELNSALDGLSRLLNARVVSQ